MENADNAQVSQQPAGQPLTQAVKPEKKEDEEFSFAWNMKALAVIYVLLGILYFIIKFTIK
jgi:hypothetical protein